MRAWLVPILLVIACSEKPTPAPPISERFVEDFERAELGGDWHVTDPDGSYLLTGGQLHVKGAMNHPAWLRRAMPADAVIEFDAKSLSPEGDIKFEAWGNGRHRAASKKKVQYTASGYVFIFGGWGNTRSAIARLRESASDTVTQTDTAVEPGRHYHWRIVRRGNTIEWYIDDLPMPFLRFTDPKPLAGEYFGFSSWKTEAMFDNLAIQAL